MKQQLKNLLKHIDSIDEFDEQTAEDLRHQIRSIERLAVARAMPAIVSHCQVKSSMLSIAAARLIVAKCLSDLPPPTVMSVSEAAEYLKVSTSTIYDACKAGDLKHQRVQRVVRIRREDLDALNTVTEVQADEGW